MNDVRGRTEISGYTLFDDFRSELGYTSILTPGTVAGFGAVHERFCMKPLENWSRLQSNWPVRALQSGVLRMTSSRGP